MACNGQIQQPPTDALSFMGWQQCQHHDLAAVAIAEAVADHVLAFQRDMPRQYIVTDTGRPAVFSDAESGKIGSGKGIFTGASTQIDAGSGIARHGAAVMNRVDHAYFLQPPEHSAARSMPSHAL